MDDIKERHVGDVRQFKLASGDEIICEVIEWNDPYSTDATRQEEIIIRTIIITRHSSTSKFFNTC